MTSIQKAVTLLLCLLVKEIAGNAVKSLRQHVVIKAVIALTLHARAEKTAA